MDKYITRSDIACELLKEDRLQKDTECEYQENNITVKKVLIDSEEAKTINKKAGLYYTLDTRSINTHDSDDLEKCCDVLSKVIKEVMEFEGINSYAKGMVVGLGNINVTPDSLGPLVIDNVIVTRHMFVINPSEVSEGIREVCALAPGVMGTTGIETFDIIKSVARNIKVDYLIVVDALASSSVERVNRTIQVTQTGISPGSGVGNKRKEISKQTMGIPVIAIGVPTVVDALTIVNDAIDIIQKHLNTMYKDSDYELLGVLGSEDKHHLIDEILTPNGFDMMVCPKEVDLDIADLTLVISKAIDKAIHPIVSNHEVI